MSDIPTELIDQIVGAEGDDAPPRQRVSTGTRRPGPLDDFASVEQVADQAFGHLDEVRSPAKRPNRPAEQRGAALNLARGAVRDLLTRPEHHEVATPKAVATAWSAVEAAGEALAMAKAAREQVDRDEAEAQAAEAARVRSATAAGQSVEPSEGGRDRSAERRHADAVAAGHLDRLRAAREAYDATVDQHAQTWTATVLGEVEKARARAVKAATTAAEALEALDAAVRAAHVLGRAANSTARAVVPYNAAAAREGLERVLAEVDSDTWARPDALLDGPVNGLTFGERRAIAQRNAWDVSQGQQERWRGLLDLERRERGRVTVQGMPVARP